MDPPSAELVTMDNLEKMLEWFLIFGDLLLATTQRGSLLALLGGTQNMPPRVIGAMDGATYIGVLYTWQIAGVNPSPVLRSMAETFGQVARILSGVQLSQEVAAAQQSQQALAQAATVAVQAAAFQAAIMAVAAPPLKGRVVKLKETTQQGNEEASILPEQAMVDGFKLYFDLYKATPPPEEEVNIDQFSSVAYSLSHGPPPLGGLQHLRSSWSSSIFEIENEWHDHHAGWNVADARDPRTSHMENAGSVPWDFKYSADIPELCRARPSAGLSVKDSQDGHPL